MKLIPHIIVLFALAGPINAQDLDTNLLYEMAITTVTDYFGDSSNKSEVLSISPQVVGSDYFTLFQLRPNELDSNKFHLIDENEWLKQNKRKSKIYVYQLRIARQTSDTIDVEIDSYRLEVSNYPFSKRPLRYIQCKGTDAHFPAGQFYSSSANRSWSFISGRESYEKWRNEFYGQFK